MEYHPSVVCDWIRIEWSMKEFVYITPNNRILHNIFSYILIWLIPCYKKCSAPCPLVFQFEYFVTDTAIFPNGSFTGVDVDEARMRATVYGSNTTAADTPMLVMEKTITVNEILRSNGAYLGLNNILFTNILFTFFSPWLLTSFKKCM